MWEWIEKNREWIFSGAGITVILFFIWLFRAALANVWNFFFKREKTEIIVRVQGAVMHHPLTGFIHALSITAENHSDKDIIIGNFMLLTQMHRLLVQTDALTGAPQRRQSLRAGDSCSFHIGAANLREMGLPPEAYIAASVETPLSKDYRSSKKDLKGLQSLIAGLIEERPTA